MKGNLPNPQPLQLHQIIVNTVPNFDGNGGCQPGIEIFQNGRLIFSSIIGANQSSGIPEESEDEDYDYLMMEFCRTNLLSEDGATKLYNPLELMDNHHVFFKLQNIVFERDVQIRIFHRNFNSEKNITMLSLSFNTGFITPGVIRLKLSDVEIPMKDSDTTGLDRRFHPDFSMDLILTERSELPKLNYDLSPDIIYAKNFVKLSQYHSVRPDPQLLKPLELQGHRKVVGIYGLILARLALQLRNNDIHLAHEFITDFEQLPLHEIMEKELITLGKLKLDGMKSQNGRSYLDILRKDSTSAYITENYKALDFEEADMSYQGRQETNEKQIIEEDKPAETENINTNDDHKSVLRNSMKDTIILPPIPPLPPASNGFGSGPPPPPPPAPISAQNIKQNKMIVKTPLHWNEITHPVDIKNTVFSELDSVDNNVNLNIHQFEELFCFNPSNSEVLKKDMNSRK